MPTIYIPPQMRDLTGGAERVAADGATLREVLRALDVAYPGIAARMIAGETLAPGMAVSIDGAMTSRLLSAVRPESEIHFLPAIGGG